MIYFLNVVLFPLEPELSARAVVERQRCSSTPQSSAKAVADQGPSFYTYPEPVFYIDGSKT